MYQDTDFGKEILEGAEEQAEKLGIKLAETARTSRPIRTSPRRSPTSRGQAAT